MEFFIQNICQEILQECSKAEVECHENFLLFYLKLLVLDPVWNLHPEVMIIDRQDTLRMIKFVVKKMQSQHCPCMITLKIQMYFNCNFEDEGVIVRRERTNFKNRLKPLEDEIIDTQTEDKEQLALMRKKIIYYITLWRGLGNPTKYFVFREAKQVLISIYDDTDLVDFMEKSVEEKKMELLQLSQICSGIRIFNWTCSQGGEGIENIPEIVREALKNTTQMIQDTLLDTMDKINTLTTAVDTAYVISVEENLEEMTVVYHISCMLPTGFEYSDMEYAKDLIILFRQLEVFLRKILNELEIMTNYCMDLDDNFNDTINHFHSIVYLKVGVPTDLVFPTFIKLDKIWEDYQDVIIHTVKFDQMVTALNTYINELHSHEQFTETLLQGTDAMTDAERLERDTGIIVRCTNSNVSLVNIDGGEDTAGIRLEFLGFCPWKLVETQGGLIPGNPNMCVLKYQDKFYVFSCPEAALAFDLNPQQCINEVLELARKKTELITLLHLEDELKLIQSVKELAVEEKFVEDRVTMVSVEMQTELHPIESFIDEKYMWNIWDWKRQALRLADMSTRSTKASQTTSSSNANPVSTQTYGEKEQTTQTMIDNYTNVPTPQTYFFGLRGRKDDKQFILNLTRPVDN